jgi:hypothetical protein
MRTGMTNSLTCSPSARERIVGHAPAEQEVLRPEADGRDEREDGRNPR